MQRFLANAGRGGLLRTLLVSLVMGVVAFKGGGVWHGLAWGLSMLLGGLWGRWLGNEPELRHGYLKAMGLCLTVSAVGLGAVRDSVALDERLMIGALVSLVGLYLGAYVGFNSHPGVQILHEA
jgi:hypothetical protein